MPKRARCCAKVLCSHSLCLPLGTCRNGSGCNAVRLSRRFPANSFSTLSRNQECDIGSPYTIPRALHPSVLGCYAIEYTCIRWKASEFTVSSVIPTPVQRVTSHSSARWLPSPGRKTALSKRTLFHNESAAYSSPQFTSPFQFDAITYNISCWHKFQPTIITFLAS